MRGPKALRELACKLLYLDRLGKATDHCGKEVWI